MKARVNFQKNLKETNADLPVSEEKSLSQVQ